jgi:hypothetical protein
MVEAISHLVERVGFNLAFYAEGPDGSMLKMTSLETFAAGDGDILWINSGDEYPLSFLGIVQVVAPRIVRGDLRLASIAIKDGHSGNRENYRIYKYIVKFLKDKYRAGVWGVNEKSGGEAYYKDIYISDGAMAETANGVKLAPEGGGGFVRFELRG